MGRRQIAFGFAMPINRAKSMLEETRGHVARPFLGVRTVLVQGDLAQALDSAGRGRVAGPAGSREPAAEEAGLRGPKQVVVVGNVELGVGGDLIEAVDGKRVERDDDLQRAMNKKRAGQPGAAGVPERTNARRSSWNWGGAGDPVREHATIEQMIQQLRPGVSARNARVCLFDFDGTLSTIRSGWMDVMVPMMVEILLELKTGETEAQLRAVVEDFVWRLTGKQTMYQMIALRRRDCEARRQPLGSARIQNDVPRWAARTHSPSPG